MGLLSQGRGPEGAGAEPGDAWSVAGVLKPFSLSRLLSATGLFSDIVPRFFSRLGLFRFFFVLSGVPGQRSLEGGHRRTVKNVVDVFDLRALESSILQNSF